ncbi:hypothetical protein CCACVL1_17391 [Corchorus capsularis]|uniref:Uncharacterized protein n=1 Tax=Corchorus capsularis TaxID=210143 RepID=A0A1R3HSN2_COCAP|nr:hypothetical protein CCACVL1_17391 [Corchorus capsularis]
MADPVDIALIARGGRASVDRGFQRVKT